VRDEPEVSQAEIDRSALTIGVGKARLELGAAAARTLGSWRRQLARLTPYLAVGLGGALGANTRFFVGAWGTTQWGAAFPYATLLINVTGSFIIGFYLALVTERFAGRPATRLFVTTGFCGGYTTFSTFSVEALRLIEVLASNAFCLIAAVIGIVVAHAL
jgi:CrcB protein